MATTHVMYGGSRLIPAPFVNITKNYQTTGDGEKIGSVFQIQVIGTIVAFKGSPDSSRTFWTASGYPADETVVADSRLASIIRKQEAIRELFNTDGLQFEIQSADGSQPMRCNPRVIDISFSQDIWFDRCEYNITLEADRVTVNGVDLGEDNFSEYISSASESWSIDVNDEAEDVTLSRTYRVSHSVSATGKRFFDSANNLQKPAWQQARDWVLPKLGFDSTIALSSGVNNLPSYYQGLNHTRSEQIGERDGTYSVTETWLLASGNTIEDFSVETNESLERGIVTVGIRGNIRGLESRDANMNVTQTKWEAASARFVAVSGMAFSRAQTYAGISLNSQVVTSTVGRNPVAGTVSYNYQYDNRPSNLFTDVKSETMSVSDNFGAQNFASIFVLGRAAGPVLQNLGTYRQNTRSLNIELVFGPGYGGDGNATSRFVTNHPRNNSTTNTELNSVVAAVSPVIAGMVNNAGQTASTQYVSQQNESWDPIQGRYVYSCEWTWE